MTDSESLSPEIEINIKGPDNIKLQIKISLDKSVVDLKEAISQQSGVEADRQRLIYSGRVLKVHLTLSNLENLIHVYEIGDRKVGDPVNLERAMGAHVRFGGHFVQAHVDTTATIVSRTPDGDSVRIVFQLAPPTPSVPSVQQYLIPKGYVAIDGTSLTITQVDDAARTFGVMLIQHTRERTTVGLKQVGEKVNIEVDMIGKYVEKSVIAALGGSDEGNIGMMYSEVTSHANLLYCSQAAFLAMMAVPICKVTRFGCN